MDANSPAQSPVDPFYRIAKGKSKDEDGPPSAVRLSASNLVAAEVGWLVGWSADGCLAHGVLVLLSHGFFPLRLLWISRYVSCGCPTTSPVDVPLCLLWISHCVSDPM